MERQSITSFIHSYDSHNLHASSRPTRHPSSKASWRERKPGNEALQLGHIIVFDNARGLKEGTDELHDYLHRLGWASFE